MIVFFTLGSQGPYVHKQLLPLKDSDVWVGELGLEGSLGQADRPLGAEHSPAHLSVPWAWPHCVSSVLLLLLLRFPFLGQERCAVCSRPT